MAPTCVGWYVVFVAWFVVVGNWEISERLTN